MVRTLDHLTVKALDDIHVVARTGDRLCDLAPYAPALGADGRVAFQARTVDGVSGLFLSGEGGPLPLPLDPALRVVSHPARASDGLVGAYALDASGMARLIRIAPDGRAELLGADASWGPLGPTTSPRGDLALRGTLADGRAVIARLDRAASDPIVMADDHAFSGFEGLPLVDDGGRVTFRADLPDGRQGIFRYDGSREVTLAETGPASGLAALGRFPCLDGPDAVVCAGVHTSGWSGIFRFAPGRPPEVLARSGDGFESFRGALVSPDHLVFYAAPRGGALGVYRARRDPTSNADPVRLIGLGDALTGSIVTDLALNPVSIDARGAIAIRLALASGLQLIVTASAPPRAVDG